MRRRSSLPGSQSEKLKPQSAADDDDPSSGSGVTGQPEETTHQGKLILDATVCEQAIRYPTDLSLLNEARQFSEQIIDKLYPRTELKKKPRTYREKARKDYLAIAKRRRPGGRVRRRGIRQQLQYLRRNLKHIEGLLEHWSAGTSLPLPRWLLHRYWVMRPIVRGKQSKPVEFGAKLSVSLSGQGLARTTDTPIFSLIVVALWLLFSIGYQDARCSICIIARDGAQLIHAELTHRVRR